MRLAIALAALVCLGGCATSRPPAAGEIPPGPQRADDDLLGRPDLQALVDAQVLRDAGPLAAALGDPDPSVRARAALALGSVQAESAIPQLTAALQDTIPAVRADAAFALGQTADSTAVGFLFLALRREGTPAAQREMLDAIGKIGSQSDGDALLRLALPSDREADRALALARLAMRQRLSPAAFGVLASRLLADDPVLRDRAAYAFSRSDGWGDQADLLREAFGALASGDPARMHLARALGRLEDETDASALARALRRDPDWRVRANAAASLGRLVETRDARGALFTALEDGSVQVRVAAASALGGAESLPLAYIDRAQAFVAASDTLDWHAASGLLSALARAGRTPDVLVWTDRQTDPFAVARGVGALGEASGDDSALARLIDASGSDDTRIAGAALGALGGLWRRDKDASLAERLAPTLLNALDRGDLVTVTSSAPILADSMFRPYGASSALREAAESLVAPEALEARVAVVRAIGNTRGEGEIDYLLTLALDETLPTALRRAAVAGLNDRLVDGIDVDLTAAETSVPTEGIDWAFLGRLGRHPRLILTTDRGEIVIELDAEAAPQTVQSITRVVREGRYDGVPFHRVVPNFVLQGGDYFRRDGWGGPPVPIRSEFSRLDYRTGTLGMASSGKDTEGVQFFVTHSAQPHLDGRYTVFGQLVEGQDVADQMRVGDVIRSARVLPMTP